MTLNVAIVGMGGIGNTHGPVYEMRVVCKFVAVCDIIKEKADKAAARLPVHWFRLRQRYQENPAVRAKLDAALPLLHAGSWTKRAHC